MYKSGGFVIWSYLKRKNKFVFFSPPLINVPAGLWSPHALTSHTTTRWTRQRAQARGSEHAARLASQVSRPLRTSLCVRFHARTPRFTQHGRIRVNKKQTLLAETHLFSPGCIPCGSNPAWSHIDTWWPQRALQACRDAERDYLNMASK